jgi:hypothetical protein
MTVRALPVACDYAALRQENAALWQELRSLRTRVERLEGEKHLRPARADYAVLSTLAPVWRGALGSQLTTVRELLQSPAVALVIGARSSRSIGRLLARCAGRDVEGYRVDRIGREGHVAVWQLIELVVFPNAGNSGAPAGPHASAAHSDV